MATPTNPSAAGADPGGSAPDPRPPAHHGVGVLDDDTCRFGLWAPHAERVELDLEGRRHRMQPLDDGWWTLTAGARHGSRYGYALDDGPVRPDPAARWLPDGVHRRSAVLDLTVIAGLLGDAPTFIAPPLRSAVIYELHVGTFTVEGTFAAATDHLRSLVDLGITHVEVMPINGVDGVHNWGYDGVAWWAVHQPYGGPEGFAAFVAACHAAGLAVILDVVHNHLGPSGSYLAEFGPYLQADAESTWGRVINLDGPGSGPVRSYIIGSALMWLRDMRVDALRLDAVHALDDRGSATHVLAELSDAVAHLGEQTGRPLQLIAETDRNDPATILPRAQGGLGMDAQWADDLHHAIHVAITGETDGYYVDYDPPLEALAAALGNGLVYDGRLSTFRERLVGAPLPDHVSSRQLIACIQNHDQVGNRPAGDRLTTQVSADLVRVAVALLCTAPHTPMLFMGEEHAETAPFQFFTDMPGEDLREAIRRGRAAEFAYFTSWGDDEQIPDPLDPETFRRSTLDHDLAATPDGQARRALWTDLLALRRTHPALGTGDRRLVDVEVTEDGLTMLRHPPAHAVGASATPTQQVAGAIRVDLVLDEREVSLDPGVILHTQDARYGGSGVTRRATVHGPVVIISDLLPDRSAP